VAIPDQQAPQTHPDTQRVLDAAQTGAAIGAAGQAAKVAVAGPGYAITRPAAAAAGVVSAAAEPVEFGVKVALALRILRKLFKGHHMESATWLENELKRRYPNLDPAVIREAVEREMRFEQAFQRKALARTERDLHAAGQLPTKQARNQRSVEILNRERHYAKLREKALLDRATAHCENAIVKEKSPDGAIWMLGNRKNHTAGCLALAGKAWPWEVLDTIPPPIHTGCGCWLKPLPGVSAEDWAKWRADVKAAGGFGTVARQQAARNLPRPQAQSPEVPPPGEAMRMARAAMALEEAVRAVADPGEIDDYLDGLPVRPSVERALMQLAEAEYTEALHPRGRGGRWVHILSQVKAAKMDDITDVEGHSVMRLKDEGYSVRVGAGNRVKTYDPEVVADAIEKHLDERAKLGTPVTLANMDDNFQKWFSPQKLDGGKETHPKSGYDVHVGKWLSVQQPPPDTDGEPVFKVTDYGEHAGDQMFPKAIGTEPIKELYRGMSIDEWNQAVKRGYIQSDRRGVIGSWEGTNAGIDPQTSQSYLPRGAESVIAKMTVRPEEEWFTRNEDGYLRTRKRIPMSQVTAVSPVMYKDPEEGLFVRPDSTSAAKLTKEANGQRAAQARGPDGSGGRARGADLVRLAPLDASTDAGYQRYTDAVKANPHSEFITQPSQEELGAKRVWLSDDGHTGVTVSADGEVGNLFANNDQGAGGVALDHAVANGGTWLNCFDGALPKIYRRHGFTEVVRLKFDPEHKPEGWDMASLDSPDVVFMGHGGEPVEPVPTFTDWDEAERAVLEHIGALQETAELEEKHWTEWLHPRGRGGVWVDAIHHEIKQTEPAEPHEGFTGEDFARAMDGFEHGGIVAVRANRTSVQNLYGEVWLNLQKKGEERPVGLARVIVRPPNNREERVAEYANIYLREGEQQHGFGRAFTDHLFKTLREGGVDRINVEAVSVGGYAWARRGFVWTGDAKAEQQRIVADAKADGRWAQIVKHTPPAALSEFEGKIERGEFSSEAELAAYGIDRPWHEEALPEVRGAYDRPAPTHEGRTWLGKQLLIGSRWKGSRPVTVTAPSLREAYEEELALIERAEIGVQRFWDPTKHARGWHGHFAEMLKELPRPSLRGRGGGRVELPDGHRVARTRHGYEVTRPDGATMLYGTAEEAAKTVHDRVESERLRAEITAELAADEAQRKARKTAEREQANAEVAARTWYRFESPESARKIAENGVVWGLPGTQGRGISAVRAQPRRPDDKTIAGERARGRVLVEFHTKVAPDSEYGIPHYSWTPDSPNQHANEERSGVSGPRTETEETKYGRVPVAKLKVHAVRVIGA
jgi:hypothetical protein